MSRLMNLIERTIDTGSNFIATSSSTAVDITGCSIISVEADVTVSGAKTCPTASVSVANDTFTITSHGFLTGLAIQLTTSGLALPAGLSTSTTYYIIAVDANTIAFATTLNHANSGTKINITDQGTAASTITVTPLTASMTLGLEQSNNNSTWFTLGSTQSCTATGNFMFGATDPQCRYIRITFTVTSGEFTVNSSLLGKGPN
jgi:hypothetical protein